MKFIYTMFAVVGWTWCLAAAGYILFHRRRAAVRPQGFEVMKEHEEQLP